MRCEDGGGGEWAKRGGQGAPPAKGQRQMQLDRQGGEQAAQGLALLRSVVPRSRAQVGV